MISVVCEILYFLMLCLNIEFMCFKYNLCVFSLICIGRCKIYYDVLYVMKYLVNVNNNREYGNFLIVLDGLVF